MTGEDLTEDAKPNVATDVPQTQRAVSIHPQTTLSQAILANCTVAMSFGLNPVVQINALLDAVAYMIAGFEPVAAREQLVSNIRRNLRSTVEIHYTARHTSGGGIVLPSSVTR